MRESFSDAARHRGARMRGCLNSAAIVVGRTRRRRTTAAAHAKAAWPSPPSTRRDRRDRSRSPFTPPLRCRSGAHRYRSYGFTFGWRMCPCRPHKCENFLAMSLCWRFWTTAALSGGRWGISATSYASTRAVVEHALRSRGEAPSAPNLRERNEGV